MLVEGLTITDVDSLSYNHYIRNQAANTVLAMRETMLALGHEESVGLDRFCEEADFEEAYVQGIALAPIDVESKVGVLIAHVDRANFVEDYPDGRKRVLRHIGRASSVAYRRSVFEDERAISHVEQLHKLDRTFRREVHRPTREERLASLTRRIMKDRIINNVLDKFYEMTDIGFRLDKVDQSDSLQTV